MYAGHRGNATARRYARVWSTLFSAGVVPGRWVTLEVPGRVSGRPTRFPLGYADLDGRCYLVSMLGEECNWVKNVRAADGRATLRHGKALPCLLVELPVDQRPAVLKRYLAQVPGGRPHLPVEPGADLAAFDAIAEHYPVFEIKERPH
jgi:hypothetical protein